MRCSAMQLKQLMRCMQLLLFTLWTCLRLSVGQVPFLNYTKNIWGPICGNGQYGNGSLFQCHLNQVFESLVGNGSMSGFNTSTVQGQNRNNTVYGLLQCRGDLNSTECQQCASTTKAIIVEKCQNNTSGFIEVDGCLLRYDNHNFYNYNESSEINGVCSSLESDQIEQFTNETLYVLSNISKSAVQNLKYFATDVSEVDSSPSKQIYSLAQCWRELSEASCQSCLAAGWSNITAGQPNIPGCGGRSNITAIGAKFHTIGCNLRYGIYDFYPGVTSAPSSGIFLQFTMISNNILCFVHSPIY